MSDPVPYERTYSFTDYQAGNPSAPLPGIQVDNELENVEQSLGGAIDAIKDLRRSDGKLKNGIVTIDSLDPTVAAGVGAGALASAEAAAASADAASDSAVAAAASATAAGISATAASGYASNALTSRNEAETERTLAQSARTGAQTARDFANKWATEASDVEVDDGVNDPGYSAYHWAQIALDATAGSIADGSVTTAKIADGAFSADTTGRAKMADGFVTSAKIADGEITSAKIADGTIATADLADGSVTSAKLGAGVLTPPVFHVRDQKATNTNGGTSSTGIQVRVLNTTVLNTIAGASLASNVITLPAGVYDVIGFTPAFASIRHKAWLRVSGGGATVLDGLSSFAQNTVSHSSITGRLTVASTSTYEIAHFFETGVATNGLGVAVNASGQPEVYADIIFRKVG